jgi:hypothetical protein
MRFAGFSGGSEITAAPRGRKAAPAKMSAARLVSITEMHASENPGQCRCIRNPSNNEFGNGVTKGSV